MSSDLHSGHRDRMKSKFRNNGIECFEDHEKLEVLLYSIFPRINTNELAHNLINNFGSLHGVLNASESELTKIKGFGETSAFQLSYFGALSRYLSENGEPGGIILKSLNDIVEYARKIMDFSFDEQFMALFLDKRHALLSKLSFNGKTTSMAEGENKLLVKHALNGNSSYVVLVHSHNGKNVLPSSSDVVFTRKISMLLRSVGITLDDHIIIDVEQSYSMRASYLLGDMWTP